MEFLINIVERYLASCSYDTARFYAERVMSCCCLDQPNSVERKMSYSCSIHLLALCYYRMGKMQQTYLILLEQCTTALPTVSTSEQNLQRQYKYTIHDNKYLFALACFDLEKLGEAERVLLSMPLKDHSQLNFSLVSSCLNLLGKICRRQHRRNMSIGYFIESLQVRIKCGSIRCMINYFTRLIPFCGHQLQN